MSELYMMEVPDAEKSDETKKDFKPSLSCRVCGDKASGRHYGTLTCDGCRGFFKRSVRRHLSYSCRENNQCIVDVSRRNQCQACRLSMCFRAGMKKEAVQHERAPRSRLPEDVELTVLTSPRSMYRGAYNASGERTRPASTEPLLKLAHDARSSYHGPLTPPLTPKPSINLETAEQLYELSMQILYTSITWARNIPTFNELPFRDQSLVLEESWAELFLLSLAQWGVPLDMDLMLQVGGIGREDSLSEEIKATISDLARLQYVVGRFRVMDLDATEFACLKAVTLFKPELQGLEARHHVEQLQDQAQAMMQDYSRSRGPQTRFGRLILKLPLLREIPPQLVEKHFLRGSLCNISSKKFNSIFFSNEAMPGSRHDDEKDGIK